MSGLACTLCALGVLLRQSPVQQAELAGSPLVTGSRVLHLTLAGSERKARFGVSPSLTWAEFLQGVQERLHLDRAPDKIETSAGWVIRSVSDLMHRDNVVVYPHATHGDLAAPADAAPAHAAHTHAAQPHPSSGERRPSSSGHPPRTAAEAAAAAEAAEAAEAAGAAGAAEARALLESAVELAVAAEDTQQAAYPDPDPDPNPIPNPDPDPNPNPNANPNPNPNPDSDPNP